VVLWTGGKDSALALHLAKQAGYLPGLLVTFAPPNPQFLAHPIPVIKAQCKAMAIDHRTVTLPQPTIDNYVEELSKLRQEGIEAVVTGDIDEVEGMPNWIQECARKSGLECHFPLWKKNREEVLNLLIAEKFRCLVSLIYKGRAPSWLLGRILDGDLLLKLKEYHKESGMDLCGEQGEYHTWVLDGPCFKIPIHFEYETSGTDSHLHLRLLNPSIKS
jgi:diphthine-ammonia ligase